MKKVFLLSSFALLMAGSSVMAGDKKECAKACTKEHGNASCCKKKDAACCKKHEGEKPTAAPAPEKK